MNTIPFAVDGRWRATATRRPRRRPCGGVAQLRLGRRHLGQVRTEELERMDSDGEARLAGSRRASAPRRSGRAGRGSRRSARAAERAARPRRRARDGLGARRRARAARAAPPRLAERVAGARGDEGLEPVAAGRRALDEVDDAPGRTPALALLDDSPRIVLPDGLHVFEPDAYGLALEHALRRAHVDVRRKHLHPTPLRVPHQARGRVEAHRLRVQQRARNSAG